MNASIKREKIYWNRHFHEELLRMKKSGEIFSQYYWMQYHQDLAGAIKDKSKSHKNRTVLELGCGSGKASLLTNLEASYYLVDIAENALQTAEYLSEILGIKKIKTFRRDVFNNKLSPNFFDIVVSIGLIEHYTSPEIIKLCAEINRVIKDQGTIFLGIPNYRSLAYQKANFLKRLDKKFIISKIIPGYRNHSEKPYSESDMRKIFRLSKLNLIETEYVGPWLFVETPKFIIKLSRSFGIDNYFYKNNFLTLYILEKGHR